MSRAYPAAAPAAPPFLRKYFTGHLLKLVDKTRLHTKRLLSLVKAICDYLDMATPQRESLLRRGLTVYLDTNC